MGDGPRWRVYIRCGRKADRAPRGAPRQTQTLIRSVPGADTGLDRQTGEANQGAGEQGLLAEHAQVGRWHCETKAKESGGGALVASRARRPRDRL